MSADEAMKAEAAGVTMAKVEWRGISFGVPRYRIDWPFDAVEAAEQNKHASMLVALLPPLALAQFRDLRPTQRDVFDLLNAISDALGFEESGESSASTS